MIPSTSLAGLLLLVVLSLASLLPACGETSTVACSETEVGPKGATACLFSWDRVVLEPSPVPEVPTADYSWWVPTYCNSAPGDCPGLPKDLWCGYGPYGQHDKASSAGTAASWLTVLGPDGSARPLAHAPLICQSCPWADDRCSCEEGGLTGTYFRDMANHYCNFLLVPGDDGLIVLRSPGDLASYFAPVETGEEALAFAELAGTHDDLDGHGVQHRYWGCELDEPLDALRRSCDDYQNVPGHWGFWLPEETVMHGCTEAVIGATTVELDGQDWLVHTFVVPAPYGGTSKPLQRVDVRVTRDGTVTVYDPVPLCFGDVHPYDEVP